MSQELNRGAQGSPQALVLGTGTLSRAAAMVAEAEADFETYRHRLDAQIAGLQGRWLGAGGSAFLGLHQAWSERQRVITGALGHLESALLSTERDTTATDRAQAEAYAHTATRLG